MKYAIDLPDDYDKDWIMVDMPMTIRSDGADYMRRKTLLEPYKPELDSEPEVFKVGDEVVNSDGEDGYVLVPDYGNNNCIVLMKGYEFPQYQNKRDWKKANCTSNIIRKYVKLAYDALNEVDK